MSIVEILAVIPARGGSRGVPNKNIRVFAGKPLIAHTIGQAKLSKRISRVIVSTESELVAAVARRYGAEVPFLRPKHLAEDRSLVVDAIVDLLEKLKKVENYSPDLLVLLQPTSPMRQPSDIDNAIDLLLRRRTDAVLSVCRTEQLVFTKDKFDRLHLESNPAFLKSTNRQELPPTYKFDGCTVYVIKPKILLKEKTFFPKSTCAYVIPRWRAVDLDEPEDFIVGEIIYNKRYAIDKALKQFKS